MKGSDRRRRTWGCWVFLLLLAPPLDAQPVESGRDRVEVAPTGPLELVQAAEGWPGIALEIVREVDAFLQDRAGEEAPRAAPHRVVDVASFDTLAANLGWPVTSPEAWRAAFTDAVGLTVPERVRSGRCSETCAMEGSPRVYSLRVLGEPGRWDAPPEFEGFTEHQLLAVVRVGFNVGREGEPHPAWRSGYQEHFFVLDAALPEAPRLVRKLDMVRIATGPAPR